MVNIQYLVLITDDTYKINALYIDALSGSRTPPLLPTKWHRRVMSFSSNTLHRKIGLVISTLFKTFMTVGLQMTNTQLRNYHSHFLLPPLLPSFSLASLCFISSPTNALYTINNLCAHATYRTLCVTTYELPL